MIRIIIILLFYIKLAIPALANPKVDARTAILIDYHSDKILLSQMLMLKFIHVNDENHDFYNCF